MPLAQPIKNTVRELIDSIVKADIIFSKLAVGHKQYSAALFP